MKLKRRYIGTYIAMALVPITIFAIFFYQYHTYSRDDQAARARQATFAQSVLHLNSFFDRMQEVSLQISASLDTMLVRKGNSFSQINESQIISELSNYENKVLGQTTILLYPRGDTNVYLSDGKYPYANIENMWKNVDTNISNLFYKLISGYTIDTFQLTNNFVDLSSNETYIAQIIPLPYLSSRPSCSVAFLFSQNALSEIIEDTMGEFDGDVLILNSIGGVIYSREAAAGGLNTRDLTRLKGVGLLENAIPGHVVLRSVSEKNGMTVIIAMQRKEFYRYETPMIIWASLVILLIGVCLLIAVKTASYSYNPIRKLLYDLAGNDIELSSDELDFIRESYHTAKEKSQKLEIQLSSQSAFVTDQLLLRLIQGKCASQGELDYQLSCAGVSLNYDSYAVLVGIVPNHDERRYIIDNALSKGKHLELETANVFVLEVGLEERLVCVCCLQGEQAALSGREQAFRSVVEAYTGAGINGFIWGGGMCYSSLLELRNSYFEAIAVLQNAVLGDQRLYLYNNAAESQESAKDVSIPTMELSVLVESIRHGDAEMAMESLAEIIAVINSHGTSFLITQMLCYDVLNVVGKLLSQQGMEVAFNQYKMVSSFRTLSEFQNFISEIISISCEEIAERRAAGERQKKSDLISFIRENYRSGDMSLDLLSEKMNLSKSRIHSILKEDLNCSFSQFVVSLRMEEVKRLLVNTDDMIQDIVASVGYLDAANFARKFKAIEGITPGQYRQIYRGKQR